MAIAGRVLIEIVLMILLGSIKPLQRQHLDSQRRSIGSLNAIVGCAYYGQHIAIDIVYSRAIARADIPTLCI